MNIQHKGRRMETEIVGEIYGIKRNVGAPKSPGRNEWMTGGATR